MAANSLQDVSRSPEGLAVDRPETPRVEPRGKVTWLAQSAAAQSVELQNPRVQLNEGLQLVSEMVWPPGLVSRKSAQFRR